MGAKSLSIERNIIVAEVKKAVPRGVRLPVVEHRKQTAFERGQAAVAGRQPNKRHGSG